jgi:hypothetical protein
MQIKATAANTIFFMLYNDWLINNLSVKIFFLIINDLVELFIIIGKKVGAKGKR